MKKTFDFFRPEEKLPEASGQYLCFCKNGYYAELAYSAQYRLFNAHDGPDFPQSSMTVIFWAELPKRGLTK